LPLTFGLTKGKKIKSQSKSEAAYRPACLRVLFACENRVGWQAVIASKLAPTGTQYI
jgi:hypothetical protein